MASTLIFLIILLNDYLVLLLKKRRIRLKVISFSCMSPLCEYMTPSLSLSTSHGICPCPRPLSSCALSISAASTARSSVCSHCATTFHGCEAFDVSCSILCSTCDIHFYAVAFQLDLNF